MEIIIKFDKIISDLLLGVPIIIIAILSVIFLIIFAFWIRKDDIKKDNYIEPMPIYFGLSTMLTVFILIILGVLLLMIRKVIEYLIEIGWITIA